MKHGMGTGDAARAGLLKEAIRAAEVAGEGDDGEVAATAEVPAIVVEKLTKNVNENHLREIFGAYGSIQDVDLPMNKQCENYPILVSSALPFPADRSTFAVMTNRGIAYILYTSAPAAEAAITHMHEAQLDGADLAVSIVLPRRRLARDPPPASSPSYARGRPAPPPSLAPPQAQYRYDNRGPPPMRGGPPPPGAGYGGGRYRSPMGYRSPPPGPPPPRGGRYARGGGAGGGRGGDDTYRPTRGSGSRSRSPPPRRERSWERGSRRSYSRSRSRSYSRSPVGRRRPYSPGPGAALRGRRDAPRRGRRSPSYSSYSSYSERSRSRGRGRR
ncbi:MAG: hypothetical protein M1822_009867 [Bathelium mastoideum]|nr:MAG: hypothetical protein M1822_009867 [Bathelium mastoideum]